MVQICAQTITLAPLLIKKINCDNTRVIARFYANAYYSNISFRDSAVNPLNPIQFNYATITDLKSYNQFVDCGSIVSKFYGDGMGIYYQTDLLQTIHGALNKACIIKHLGLCGMNHLNLSSSLTLKIFLYSQVSLIEIVKKFLLLTDGVYDVIDFYDDVDFYLVKRDRTGLKAFTCIRVKDYAFQNGYTQRLRGGRGATRNLCKNTYLFRQLTVVFDLYHGSTRRRKLRV